MIKTLLVLAATMYCVQAQHCQDFKGQLSLLPYFLNMVFIHEESRIHLISNPSVFGMFF